VGVPAIWDCGEVEKLATILSVKQIFRNLATCSLAVTVLFQAGCGAVAPLQTERQEHDRLELREQFAISTYPGKSQEEVFDAVEQVLRGLDENGDFSFERTANRLLASRDWRWFAVFMGRYSRHYFEFTASQSEEGLKLAIAGMYKFRHRGWSKPNWDRFIADIPYSGAWSSGLFSFFTADDYRLLHKQTKYKLGLADRWFGCKEARAEKLETALYWSPYLCYDGHGWNDD